jgi:repressor LexA
MIDGEATVKVYRPRCRQAELLPAAAVQPIPGDQAITLGKVVSVLRRL